MDFFSHINSLTRFSIYSCFDYFLYKFKDSGDYIECVIGCELKEPYVDFSDNNDYYIGIYPIGFDSNNAFNPEIDSNFIKLSLLPRES